MSSKRGLSDLEVEQEIQRLRESEFVELAKMEERTRYRRRQLLYSLRVLEKKGKALAAAGITLEMLRGVEDEEGDEL